MVNRGLVLPYDHGGKFPTFQGKIDALRGEEKIITKKRFFIFVFFLKDHVYRRKPRMLEDLRQEITADRRSCGDRSSLRCMREISDPVGEYKENEGKAKRKRRRKGEQGEDENKKQKRTRGRRRERRKERTNGGNEIRR
ncbi:hypothetical protein ANN_05299 [Periplaneta americana]|uniref:Uncharacterized protein n=1 Tax=Periplaneta americana TaxID=6978 RepID=A0ABQ8TD97_PERAM|nr:hypothetical protein ANN_05299 [Periplaneta americana]